MYLCHYFKLYSPKYLSRFCKRFCKENTMKGNFKHICTHTHSKPANTMPINKIHIRSPSSSPQ